MTVYLEDHPPARTQYRPERRAAVTGAIVVHTAENRADPTRHPDTGAENVAHFISTRTDPGSYHTIVDSDSAIDVGRYEWEMFHEGTGGNRWSLGLAFACRADQWTTLPHSWVDPALRNAAVEAARMAAWVHSTTGIFIPARRITRSLYRDGYPGFISHSTLDPDRRHDPGNAFPWTQFLTHYDTAQRGQTPMPTNPYYAPETNEALRLLRDHAGYTGDLDGWFGPQALEALHRLKNNPNTEDPIINKVAITARLDNAAALINQATTLLNQPTTR